MVESMKRHASGHFARLCDEALGLDGVMTRLYVATTWNAAPEHFRPWLEEEQDATGLRSWEPMVIPGLVQTEEYAREMFATAPNVTPEEIEERLAGRMRRQAILRGDNPPSISLVMDQSVLHRRIGAARIMEEQLRYLLEIADQPTVLIQIVPNEAGAHCGLAGGFIIAEKNGTPYAAFAEGQPRGRTFAEQSDIARLLLRYDRIRAEALPLKASVKLIEGMVNKSG